MDIIIGKRGSGKTAKLIRRSSEEGIYILTSTRQRANCIASMARKMGLIIPYPVTIDECLRGKFKGSSIQRDGLLIDDADDVLRTIFYGIPIKEITITDYDDVENGVQFLDKKQEEVYHYCEDCSQCRYDEDENAWFCRRSYTYVDPEQSACDDFELDD